MMNQRYTCQICLSGLSPFWSNSKHILISTNLSLSFASLQILIQVQCLQMQGPYKNPKTHIPKHNSKGSICYKSALCCACSRLSVDSSIDEIHHHYAPISSLAHAMVQERLTQMINEAKELEAKRRAERRRKGKKPVVSSNGCSSNSGIVVMVAMEKRSIDPREDFRNSMEEMIVANRIEEPKDLRYLLNCYISMNSEEYRATILEVFYEVCSDMFFSC